MCTCTLCTCICMFWSVFVKKKYIYTWFPFLTYTMYIDENVCMMYDIHPVYTYFFLVKMYISPSRIYIFWNGCINVYWHPHHHPSTFQNTSDRNLIFWGIILEFLFHNCHNISRSTTSFALLAMELTSKGSVSDAVSEACSIVVGYCMSPAEKLHLGAWLLTTPWRQRS